MLAAAVLGTAAPSPSYADDQAAERERRLAELRERIGKLEARIAEGEADKREVRDALRASERAISEASRALARLDAEARSLREEARRLAERRERLERTLSGEKAALGRLLAARHSSRAPDAIRIALSGEDPAQIARRLYYLTHLSRAAADIVASVKRGIADLERLRKETLAKAGRLAEVESAQRADRNRLLAERRERKRVLERIAGEIRVSRERKRALVEDEQRLARLVEELGSLLAATSTVSLGNVENVAEPLPSLGPFSELRGKLRLPVRGELLGRFGAPRPFGGPGTKGVFIRAPQGQPVRAIAQGQVVFADWMRGFGNLLIIDHGEAYLSVYANNEAVLKQLGDPVAAGEAVALVGASGGNDQTGLYFEIRHLGKAFDPLLWVTVKE